MPLSQRIHALPSQTRAVSQPPIQPCNLSSESYEMGQGYSNKQFNQTNRSLKATIDSNVTDPPFIRLESGSLSEDMPSSCLTKNRRKTTTTHSSSADNYQSIINDQMIEIQKLKKKLKQNKQDGPGLLRKDKLFEFKIHGLSKEGRRELEVMLCDFVTALAGSSDTFSSRRWRGSTEVIALGSDHSVDGSRQSSETVQAQSSNKSPSNFSPQILKLPECIHYRPLSAQQSITDEQSTTSDSLSSPMPLDDSYVSDWQPGLSIHRTGIRQKRRHGGTVIYYNDAPFYTDLSRDPRGTSPFIYKGSSNYIRQDPPTQLDRRPSLQSNSCRSYIPPSDGVRGMSSASVMDTEGGDDDVPELVATFNEDSSGLNMEFPRYENSDFVKNPPLEMCSLGGVWPADRFVVRVVTKRQFSQPLHPSLQRGEHSTTITIVDPVWTTSRMSRAALSRSEPSAVEIKYLSESIERMEPVFLPLLG